MRRARSLGPLILGLIWLCGCAGSGSTPQSEGTRQQFLSLGTAPPGGAFFVVGGAIGKVLNEYRGERPWEVTAEATKGSQENIRRLARGELDLALANSAISYFAYRGEEGWDQAYPIRTVMTLAPNVALFITPQGSKVKAIGDLRGRRIVVGPAGAGFEFFIRPLLRAHGLGYDDFTPLNATQTGAVNMLTDGSAAAAFLGGAVPTASITQASTSQAIHFIPFDPRAIEQLTAQYLFFEHATIPAGTYRGQAEDFHGLDVGSMHLITSAEKSDELIYELTRTIYENRERVTEKHAAGRAINPGVGRIRMIRERSSDGMPSNEPLAARSVHGEG
jgi:TRAP transporter TAXI family solute receptor